MRTSGCFLFFALLVLAYSCDSYQGDFDESLPDQYTLTTTVTPVEGGDIQPSGGEFLVGESRQILARPAEGYVFDHWTGDLSGESNPHTIKFNSNKTVNAHFSLRGYSLNLEIIGNGAVSESVVERTTSVTVRLEAIAEEGWFFDGWEGDLSGSDNPETITIDGNEEKSVKAIFKEIPPEEYTVTISTQGSGTVERNPDKEVYIAGDEITLTAKAASGWKFIEWKGDLSGNSNPVEIVADKDKKITAVFERVVLNEYTVTINTQGSGTVESNPDKKVYKGGEEVTLTAKAASGWRFSEWKGDLSGSLNPETIIIDADKQITAVFEQIPPEEYTVTISTEGSGSVNKDPNKPTYIEGEEVTLTATTALGWTFSEWTGDLSGSSNPETIVVDEDKQITAVFEEIPPEEYTVSISTEGSGSVNKDPNKPTYIEGEEVTLTANAALGWTFREWTGDLSGSSNPETIVVDEDKQITAVFEEIPPEEYTVSINTEGSGSVNKDPNKSTYIEGEEVTLTATADMGWIFKEWTGDLSGSSNPETIVVDEDKQITAVFEEIPPEEYTVSINTEGSGSVNKDPNKPTYIEGEEVTLTATADMGWIFKEWTGDLSGSSNPETIVVDEDKQITAVFEEEPDLGLTVQEVKFYIKEMKLGGTRRTKDFSTKDFILNVPVDGTPFEITHVTIPPGFYDELELDIKKPDSKAEVNDSDFRDGSGSYTVVVKGIYNGSGFTYRSPEDYELDVSLSPHLEITSGQTRIIALTLDFDGWFKDGSGGFLDPNDSGNRKQIDKNIENSFSDFEDGF
ncbi:InlB B-repeat-containing protein [Rhodohalobacter sp.]|uniref:InlB B-repeat-containing protein n=1 Tax=Rhodohalobacter sp. TaxID=1974210 RepID=UPI002ACDE338|nr:InlB B-repeat-containing protein [Rhodohalobacter sp.]MDZ7756742.1 InlB B-repeat-containing protein [Rhodohalobacter sp.]